MDISTRYNIGDTVWVVMDDYATTPCPACDEGKITGKNGAQYDCPNCEGEGIEYGEKQFVTTELLISNLRFEASHKWTSRTQYSDDCLIGPWYSERKCYPTGAEAQAAADRLNASG